MLINFHIHQTGVFSQSELLLSYNQKFFIAIKTSYYPALIKIACYSCQILKLFLIIVFLITDVL
jgi:hypothetical protein